MVSMFYIFSLKQFNLHLKYIKETHQIYQRNISSTFTLGQMHKNSKLADLWYIASTMIGNFPLIWIFCGNRGQDLLFRLKWLSNCMHRHGELNYNCCSLFFIVSLVALPLAVSCCPLLPPTKQLAKHHETAVHTN